MSIADEIHTAGGLEAIKGASTLIEVLRIRAIEQADRLAYRFLENGETAAAEMSFGELDQKARAIGVFLQTIGAANERVLLLFPPGLDYVTAFFGCLYAGAIAVPAYPPRLNQTLVRLRAIAPDCEAKFALTTEGILSRIQSLLAETPDLALLQWHTTESVPYGIEESWRCPETTSDSLAFIQYTSGSTATPKGVMVSHGNLLHNSILLSRAFMYTGESSCVSWLPVYHDMGLIGGVLQPLYGGFPCTLMSPAAFLQQPVRWLRAISRYKATISGAPNFAYELCVAKIKPEQRESLDLRSWAVAFNGSEPVHHETLERFASAFKECGFRRDAFYHCYGLAEATLFVSGSLKLRPPIKRLEAKGPRAGREVKASRGQGDTKTLVSCGKASQDSKVIIANPESLTRCTPGSLGEIWVSNASVAKGYWGRPEETSHTFNAHLADTGEGPFLRTGDLGFIEDGEIFVTGRLKELIIIRGSNYYPPDIELTVQKGHPAFRQGCGAAFSIDLAGEERLAIVQEVDQRRQANADTDELISLIRQSVAESHEIQAYAVALVAPGVVPKTSSGKIQRLNCRSRFLEGSLPVLALWQNNGVRETNVAPLTQTDCPHSTNEIASILASQLASRLGVAPDQIDINRPIARYGLDSLMATEFMHKIEANLGVNLSLSALLQSPTLAELAAESLAQLQTLTPTRRGRVSVPLEKSIRSPLSRGQQALWYLQQLAPESSLYNIAAAVIIKSPLQTESIREAFQALVSRHSSLRTTFSVIEGQPAQILNEYPEPFFREESISGWDETKLHEKLAEEARRPFDLEKGPLLRVTLLSRSEEEHILLLVIHHIVADFWSLGIMIHEIGLSYSALKSNKAISLDPLPINYTDYVHWQQDMLASPEGERLYRYWRKRLTGKIGALNLPTDRPKPPVQTYNGDSLAFRFDTELSQKVIDFSRTQGVTLYTTLLAAFQVLLHRYSGQDEVQVGSLMAGRKLPESVGVVGYFVRPVVLTADLAANPSFESFLSQVKTTVIEAFDHQDYPFPLLVEQLQPERDLSRPPLFQVMFVFQKSHLPGEEPLALFALGESGARMRLGELSIESLSLKHKQAQFDLTLVMAEVGGELRGSIEYNSDLFDAATIARLKKHFEILLQGIVNNPGWLVSELPLLDDEEKRQILLDWNDSETIYAKDLTIHELFEAQVERTPDAPAITFAGQTLTYAQLNRRANQVAHYLRRLCVEPEMPVGICLDRSLEMMIGLLGILKSGGAYLPLDPTYPRERLAWLIEDACVSTLLTRRSLLQSLPSHSAHSVYLDTERENIAELRDDNPQSEVLPDNLAYIIYTSGSTGKPKGIMVSHRAVSNFFTGMDQRIGCDGEDTLLAVTSISFDISILELFWPLTRGAKVIISPEQAIARTATRPSHHNADRKIDFSLFYFASNDSDEQQDKYRQLLEGAKFADKSGFIAIWTPERHFHAFGGLYPNPSVMSAALAVTTERAHIRAGSVVLPLHNPIRVAEEWSLVDNLSKGRAAVAFASGWHADDFALFPENYPQRKEIMFSGIETVKKLWRGESISVLGGGGNEIEVRIFPKPVQKELPVWITAAGSPDTFIKAGEIGANILTHLLGQTIEEVAETIKLYRGALARNGHDPEAGRVTMMLHTFIGEDREKVKRIVSKPFTDYLRSSVGLITNFIKSLNLPLNLDAMSEKDMNDLMGFAFDRYFETSALFGTPDTCGSMIESLKSIGVDEIACLVDFGVDVELAMSALNDLRVLKERSNTPRGAADTYSINEASVDRASLMQCTPSTMKMFMPNPTAMNSLKSLKSLMLGGEALPVALAKQVVEALPCRVINMYGPTETTIWSSTQELGELYDTVPIGRPIANTQMHILDRFLQPVPAGVVGRLYIGGEGLARGYFNRPGLTAEKFIPNHLSTRPGARLYDTGDMASYLPDGAIKFLGRTDHQVKIRGFRIELEEIEAVLGQHPLVREAVVIAHDFEAGDKRMVAYIVARDKTALDVKSLRNYLRQMLPDYMIPSVLLAVDGLPLTSNGKVDRKALPAPDAIKADLKSAPAPPHTGLERAIAEIWQQVLKVDKVSIHDNFFDLGGHSLLMAQVHSLFREKFNRDFPLIKLLEHPTISSLARYMAEQQGEDNLSEQSSQRANRQRESLKRQRQKAARNKVANNYDGQ